MEIPYTVTARSDTGLWNAKLGIWLFLASEVMLFGGLFSGYIFLRVGADYPWPIHELKILPGFINTLVLIASSVTVVLAWASLKMRKYGSYRLAMGFTLLCALAFMGIKAYEYYGKFTHYAVVLDDGSEIRGHHFHPVVIFGEVGSVTVDLGAGSHGHTIKAFADDGFEDIDGRKINAITNDWIKTERDVREAGRIEDLKVVLKPLGKNTFAIDPKHVREVTDSQLTLADGTVLAGTLVESKVTLEPDEIDLRGVENPAEAKAFDYLPADVKEHFLEHMEEEEIAFKKAHPGLDPAADPVARVEARMMKLEHGDDGGHHPTIEIPEDAIRYASPFSPRKNTYYSIYFTLTGLHGLHVVGGAIVLAYFFFTGRKMYLENPEHLANRVEVGGLFWHFVDLIWIVLFPLLYLL